MARRIVSFLPSATELLYELGAQDELYGVTHECLYPDGARTKPRVISSVVDPKKMDSKEIDSMTCQLLKDGEDIFQLDRENLLKARPDLIISQNTCEVCAAHTNQVNQAIDALEIKPQIHSMDPHNLDEILESVIELAKIIGQEDKGKQLCNSLKKRLDAISDTEIKSRPRVLAIEWVEPFFTAGHWVPEMIHAAGGNNEISETGQHSRRMGFDEVSNSNPDIIVLMPCGFDTKRTIAEYNKFLGTSKEWGSLDAVKKGNVFAVDADAYFSKPSIRTIIGVEILAKIVHPEKFAHLSVPKCSYASMSEF